MTWKKFLLTEENCRYVWFRSPDGEHYFLTKGEYRRLNNPTVLETRPMTKKEADKYKLKEVA
jgi:hypothetical protein